MHQLAHRGIEVLQQAAVERQAGDGRDIALRDAERHVHTVRVAPLGHDIPVANDDPALHAPVLDRAEHAGERLPGVIAGHLLQHAFGPADLVGPGEGNRPGDSDRVESDRRRAPPRPTRGGRIVRHARRRRGRRRNVRHSIGLTPGGDVTDDLASGDVDLGDAVHRRQGDPGAPPVRGDQDAERACRAAHLSEHRRLGQLLVVRKIDGAGERLCAGIEDAHRARLCVRLQDPAPVGREMETIGKLAGGPRGDGVKGVRVEHRDAVERTVGRPQLAAVG